MKCGFQREREGERGEEDTWLKSEITSLESKGTKTNKWITGLSCTDQSRSLILGGSSKTTPGGREAFKLVNGRKGGGKQSRRKGEREAIHE